MCDLIGELEVLSRRTVLKGAVLGTGLTAAGAVVGTGTAEARTGRPEPGHDARRYNTRLILLGTAGGPTYWTDCDRAGISSAVVVGDAAYLVDCGSGAGRRYEQAGLFGEPTPPNDFTHLRGIFLTHLHSDHVSAYPELLLYGFPGDGLGTETRPVQVFGPGRRGVLPAVYPPDRPVPPLAGPNLPGPGHDRPAAAGVRNRHQRPRPGHRGTWPGTRIGVHDIPLPAGAGVVDPMWVDSTLARSPLTEAQRSAYRQHLIGAHTTIEQVGPVA